MHEETYEDRYTTPMERRYARVLRAYRWPLKGFLRQARYILLELRWRLGDEIMAIPVVENMVKAYPHDQVALWCSYPEIFRHIEKLTLTDKPPREVDRYCLLRDASRRKPRFEDLALKVGLPVEEHSPSLPLKAESIYIPIDFATLKTPVVALAPATTWANKHWPDSYWRQLADLLRAKGVTTLEVGANHAPLGLGHDLVGKTDVLQLAHVLHNSDAVVSVDSGVMHLALAVDTPTVGLFGPTSPDYYVQPRPDFHPLESLDSCAGFWNKDRAVAEPGKCILDHASCLESIPPQEVLDRVLAALP